MTDDLHDAREASTAKATEKRPELMRTPEEQSVIRAARLSGCGENVTDDLILDQARAIGTI